MERKRSITLSKKGAEQRVKFEKYVMMKEKSVELAKAIISKDFILSNKILKQNPFLINRSITDNGMTPLMLACYYTSYHIVEE